MLPESAISLPGGWAKHGWTTLSLEHAPDDLIRELIEESLAGAPATKRS